MAYLILNEWLSRDLKSGDKKCCLILLSQVTQVARVVCDANGLILIIIIVIIKFNISMDL
jgi:hypothetical protein